MNKLLSNAIINRTRFRKNILEIKLTKAKEGMQNNKITVSHF